jgi:Caspase domain
MAGVRRALIVATDEYGDPKLTSLSAPATDARVLAEVLRDEAVGGFGVQTIFNRPSHEVELAIAEFFGAGKYGDTLLAHFSCHGVKSPSGELFFATTDTDLSDTFKLKVTGVPSALVRDAMEESRASLILCLVDCCYSGAFVKLAKAADTVDLTERLGGKGRAVITASTSLQLALDGEEEPSLFTHAVIDGLRSGDADRDLDGLVSLDELYNYVHERVTSLNPDQTPVKSFDVEGEVYVARRSTPVTRPAPLEPELLSDAHSPVTYQRLGAVQGLATVMDEKHPGRSLAARIELARLASEDDSLKVRGQAQAVLDAAGELPAPVIPDYEPASTTRGGPVVRNPTPTPSPPDTDSDTDGAEGSTEDGGRGIHDRRHPIALTRAGLVSLGVIGALAVGAVTWQTFDNDEGDGTSVVEDAGPVLPDTELLLGAEDPVLGTGIVGFDAESRNTRAIVHDPAADFPTISEDREWMVYLVTRGKTLGGVPRLARVDGSDDAPLLDSEAREDCPFTTRPAFSLDGGLLAAMCVDASGRHFGLAIIDRDGGLVRLVRQDDLLGAPTWTGDGRIVVMRDVEGDGTTALWVMSADGEEQAPVTDGLDGSDSHPDWSNQGLLFLRDRDGSSNAVYLDSVDSRGVSPITVNGRAQSPTWGPGDDPGVVWLEPATEGAGKTLWGMELGDASPIELNTGGYGPPAWGSR